MNIQFVNTNDDVIQYDFYKFRWNYLYKVRFSIYAFFFLTGLYIFIISDFRDYDYQNFTEDFKTIYSYNYGIGVAIGISLMIFSLISFCFKWIERKKVKILFEVDNFKTKNSTVIINSEYYIIENLHVKKEVKWAKFESFRIMKNYIIFYPLKNNINFNEILNNTNISENDMKILYEFLSRNFKEAK